MARSICKIDGCERFVNGHGFCWTHQSRWQKYGDPLGGIAPHLPVEQRLLRNLVKTETCWFWRGHRDGYRLMSGGAGKKMVLAHRLSYELHHGPIPEGMVVMHKCDVPACVNPDHLEVGTYQDNALDAIRKGRHHVVPKLRGGEGNKRAVLTPEIVREIRQSSESHAALARRYGVGKTTIRSVRSGRCWSHVQ